MQNREKWYTRFSVIILIGFGLLSLEYGIKALVKYYTPSSGLKFLDLLWIKEHTNPNIAFGIPLPHSITLIASTFILAVLAYYFVRFYRDAQINYVWALNFIIWGAVANYYDRIKYGEVLDYITFGGLPIFNLADVFIILGVGLFAYCAFIKKNRETRNLSPA